MGKVKTSVELMTVTVDNLKEFAELWMKELTELELGHSHKSGEGTSMPPESVDTSPLGFGGPSLVNGFLQRTGQNSLDQTNWNGNPASGAS